MRKNGKYSCVLFDMDGTLVDSYQGIFESYRWTMQRMNREFGGDAFVQRAIGAPLIWVFRELCDMSFSEAEQAAACYREYYAAKGKHQIRVYDGMKETLLQLQKADCRLGVATLKSEQFAKEILAEQGLLHIFDTVCGMDTGDHFSKADLIQRCIRILGSRREETILVGDSAFDAEGARETGIAFLAVTYGFGFRSRIEAAEFSEIIADTTGKIFEKICLSGKEAGK
ncbi:MAG: HAD family hydrolase [Candidatus Merdivicinus sp.]|jgi:phosphoglycolate phosphatase